MMEYSYKSLDNSGLAIPPSLNTLDCNPHMTDPPFHTPSFGDEGFDLQPMMTSSIPSNMLHQQPPSGHLLQDPAYHQESAPHPHPHQISLHTLEPNNFSSQMYLNDVTETQPSTTAYNNVVNQQATSYNNQQQQMYSPTLQNQSNNVMLSHTTQQQQQQPSSNNSVLLSQQYNAPTTGTPQATELCTSEDSDDSIPNASMLSGAPKRPSPEPVDTSRNNKKAKVQKKKKKRDPNEPQKPVSAYALFFRDTQAAIKGQNPNASFGDVSKIVASMWDALDAEHKNVYKKKTELAKKDYLKALAAYRASLVSKGGNTPPEQGMSPQQQHSPPHQQTLQQQQQQQQQVYYSQQYQPQQASAYGYQPTVMASANLQDQASTQQTQQAPPQQQPQQQGQLMSGNTLPSINEITPHANYLQPNPMYNPMQGSAPVQACIRAGCPNPAISNAEWQDEYCSNECVVSHCRDVFSSWVASNQQQNYSTVK